MDAIRYNSSYEAEWNAFVATSRNGTFLFSRSYMDYHRDRFEDASLLFRDERGELCGLLPATMHAESQEVRSHGGLTYGGIVLSPKVTLAQVREMLRAAASCYDTLGAKQYVVKPVPQLYASYPSEEELYWLFRAGATLEQRAASSVVDLASPLSRQLWHRKVKVKATEGLTLHADCAAHLPAFWRIVGDVLQTRHGVRPVHSLSEMQLLMSRFPKEIRLFTVCNPEGKVITGAVLFLARHVVHVQYMEASEEARLRRALDWLIRQLLEHAAEAGFRYFDFGISTEEGGRFLNEGLAYQKEGFGGRTACYDVYRADLHLLQSL